jgi:hypothetical protein
MTILFMGGEMGAFIPSDSNANERTGNDTYDAAFARCCLEADGVTTYNESAAFTETADIWLHCEIQQYGSSITSTTKQPVVVLLDGSDVQVFRLESDFGGTATGGSYTWQLQYWNGTAWTNLGASFPTAAVRQVIDLHLVANTASGEATIYCSGTQRMTTTADLSGISGVAKFRNYGTSKTGNDRAAVSQVVISTTSTVAGRLWTVPVNGAGASSAWTGAYSNVDEITYADADFINYATADQVSTFAISAPTLTGSVVRAVAVTARANCGSGGPQNLQLVLRSGGTNYFSSSKALDAGYGAFVNIWETDPATSSAWVNTAVASLQPGVKSIT